MAAMLEDVRTFTLADTTIASLIADRLHELHVPMAGGKPHVYIALQSTEDERALDAAVGDEPVRFQFVLECWANIPSQSDEVASAIRDRLNNYRGTFGTHTVQGVFVQSQSDDYEARGLGGDKGMTVRSLAVEVVL